MKFDCQTIAVFTDEARNFKGNPAACMLIRESLSSEQMQQIATTNHQPATTFLWPVEGRPDHFNVRWYAVDEEILLCGHGAAAAAIFLGNKYNSYEPFILSHSHGTVRVQRQESDTFHIELEAFHVIEEVEVPQAIREGLGVPISAMYRTEGKYILLVESEMALAEMTPDFDKLRECEILGYAVTAPGLEVDFVSRTFIPHYHQLEDHATGSSHAALVPFWSKKLANPNLTSLQLSPRGGKFIGKFLEDANKVSLIGRSIIEEISTVEI